MKRTQENVDERYNPQDTETSTRKEEKVGTTELPKKPSLFKRIWNFIKNLFQCQ